MLTQNYLRRGLFLDLKPPNNKPDNGPLSNATIFQGNATSASEQLDFLIFCPCRYIVRIQDSLG